MSKNLIDILNICVEIEETAAQVYEELASKKTMPDELREIWKDLAEEEHTHKNYWLALIDAEKLGQIPPIFENLDETFNELKDSQEKIEELWHENEESAVNTATSGQVASNLGDTNKNNAEQELSNALLLAFALEFFIINRSFGALLSLKIPGLELQMPKDDYTHHINHLVDIFNRFSGNDIRMQLLGRSILRLWEENSFIIDNMHVDIMTGLATRKHFFEESRKWVYWAFRHSHNIGLLMIDADNFKQINDTSGHLIGDKVLGLIGKTIAGSIRESDIAGRYGGEEFVILVPDVSRDGLEKMAEKIRRSIELISDSSLPEGFNLSVSIGASMQKCNDSTSKERFLIDIVGKADEALYEAKNSGKNRVVFHRLTSEG